MGISYDPPGDNRAWAEMMGFDFPLLSDPKEHPIASLLDVKRPPTHPLFLIPRRVTYLIDPDGVIARAYDVGRHIEGHAQEVLDDLLEISPTRHSGRKNSR